MRRRRVRRELVALIVGVALTVALAGVAAGERAHWRNVSFDAGNADGSGYAVAIVVTVPSAADAVVAGVPGQISWTTSSTDPVKVELLADTGVRQTIARSVAAQPGTLAWTPPFRPIPGSNYRIRVTSTRSRTLVGLSEPFTIALPPISVGAPNGGETWLLGSTHTISWSTPVSGDVRVELFAGTTRGRTIIRATPASAGQISWTIPATLTPGSSYTIKITSTANAAIADASDAPFTLARPTLSITAPNGGETFGAGSTQTITWTSDVTGTVRLELLAGIAVRQVIAAAVPASAGTAQWIVWAGTTPGSTYRIRATWTASATVVDLSDNAFTITP